MAVLKCGMGIGALFGDVKERNPDVIFKNRSSVMGTIIATLCLEQNCVKYPVNGESRRVM